MEPWRPSSHARGQLQHAPHIGTGGGADFSSKLLFQPQGGSDASGIRNGISSTTSGINDGSTRGRHNPLIFAADRAAQAGVAALPVIEEHRILRVDDHQLRLVTLAANIAADGCRSTAGTGARMTIHDGCGYGSWVIWRKMLSAILLLPRQSVARSAKVN